MNSELIYEKLTQYGSFPRRIIAGIAFILHGLPKLSNLPRDWRIFCEYGRIAGYVSPSVGLLEVIGGIALLVGFLTRIVSILFIIEMIGLQS